VTRRRVLGLWLQSHEGNRLTLVYGLTADSVRQLVVSRFTFRVLLCITVSVFGIATTNPSVRAQDPLGVATQAHYVSNFPKFIEWPKSAFPSLQAPLVICVFGNKEFADSIAFFVQGETIRGRQISVRLAPALRDLHSCHLLYIGETETSSSRRKILDAVTHTNVLTVGETPDFLDSGGAFQFGYDDKLRFDVNLESVASAGLRIDSRLLALARHVQHVKRSNNDARN